MWLLRLPRVARQSPASPRIAAVISLAVVLPLLPATPTSGPRKSARQARAARVERGLACRDHDLRQRHRLQRHRPRAPAAPAAWAAATKSLPVEARARAARRTAAVARACASRSPRRCTRRPRRCSRPPQARANSASVRFMPAASRARRATTAWSRKARRSRRRSGSPRAPCRRSAPHRRAPSARARTRMASARSCSMVSGRARRDAGDDVGDDAPRILAARVVVGETMSSASSAATRPISGRLPASRSPPQPNTTRSSPAAMQARRLQRLGERIGSVRVIDDGERRAGRGRRTSPCARSPAARAPGPAPPRASGMSHASSTASTVSALSTLNSPISRSGSSTPPKLDSTVDRKPRRLGLHAAWRARTARRGGSAAARRGARGHDQRCRRGGARAASCRAEGIVDVDDAPREPGCSEQARLGRAVRLPWCRDSRDDRG